MRDAFPTRGDKAIRAQSVRGYIERHGLYAPAQAPWYATLRAELLGRSFHLRTVQGIDPTRQVDDRSFRLLDTQRVEIEQLEGGLLEGSWSGMEREAVLGSKWHAHRV